MATAFLGSDMCNMTVLYPTQSAARQIGLWSDRHGDCRVEAVYGRSAREIRSAVDRATLVVVDATEDYAQAVDAFALALGGRGAAKVVVYTERMHEGLELFVRRQGALLLFGPLSAAQWEGFFARVLPERRRRSGRMAA